ncbi:hypothetical protein GGE09_001972 [Roseobacter sp. N2S]|nr:hypothetical protein [Roseobacter sp. N2S]
MSFLIGMAIGGMAAWLVIAVMETTWEDIFPDQ